MTSSDKVDRRRLRSPPAFRIPIQVGERTVVDNNIRAARFASAPGEKTASNQTTDSGLGLRRLRLESTADAPLIDNGDHWLAISRNRATVPSGSSSIAS